MVKMKEWDDSINELRTSFEKAKENIIAKDKENQKLLETESALG